MSIKKKAYENYKLWWMLNHSHSLEELVDELELEEEEEGYEENVSISSVFSDWEYGFGFKGEIWACYEEFLENEYLDKNVMKEILINKDEYEKYLSDLELN